MVAIDGFSFIGAPPLQMGMHNSGCSSSLSMTLMRAGVGLGWIFFDSRLFAIMLCANKGRVNEWTCCGRYFTDAFSCGMNGVTLPGQAPR